MMHKQTILRSLFSLLLVFFVFLPVFAASEDFLFEDDFSSDLFGTDMLVQEVGETNLSLDDLLLTNADGMEIGGSYSFTVIPAWSKDFDTGTSRSSLATKMDATLDFDARPDTDLRIYGRADVSYYQVNGSDSLSITLMELFSDFTVHDQLFFRVGKQTLTWGVGYFFSPADLLNVNTINPFDAEADREGAVAIKANMPIGTDNLYGYIKLPGDAIDVSDLAFATKFEKVLGQTEFGFGAFYQDGEDPSAMITVSSGFQDISLFGEAVVKYGEDEVYFQGTVGNQYSWSSSESDLGFTFVGQYYYNGEPTAVNSDLDHAAAAYASVSLTDSLSVGIFWLGYLSDYSGVLNPSLTWSPVDYIQMTFDVSLPYGGLGNNQFTTFSLGFSLGGTDF